MTKLFPIKASDWKEILRNSFDGRVMEKLNLRNQRFKKFNKLRLHVDKELHKKSEYDALKLTARKNKPFFFEEKLSVMIGKPKEF